MTTLAERIAEDGVTMDWNTHGYKSDEDGWEYQAYTITIARAGRTLETPFKMGVGHYDPPTVELVLEALLSDASTYENSDGFEGWARDLGYDEDSRKAEATYRAVETQTEQLRAFLGDAYEAYLWETDS